MSDDKNLGDDLKDGFEQAAEKAKEAASDAGDAAKDAAKNIKESWNEVTTSKDNKRVLAGILAIVVGSLGVHKFILGYNQEGVIMLVCTLVISIFSFGIFSGAVWVFGLIEGIIYLTKTDTEFYTIYQENKRPWL